jgi:redox-sensitive bicupin YhaK (pirin superfamily)
VLFSGRPIGERVVARGPFVMNTDAEIVQAFGDYRTGRFGPIPRLARVG